MSVVNHGGFDPRVPKPVLPGLELVRRANAGLRPTKHHESLTIDRDREIRIAADHIYDWLPHAQRFGAALEMIIKEVQRKFRMWKEAGLHPTALAPPGTPVSRIIERTKPPSFDGSIDIVTWFAQWLCKWSLFAFPNQDVRDTALVLALQKQSKM